jgi:hypothetical protein
MNAAPQLTYRSDFLKIFRQLCGGKYHGHDVWRDFITMSAMALSNALLLDEAREKKYMDVVKRYSKDEVNLFCRLHALTVIALDTAFQDFLGSIFMELELGNANQGQFFTPYEVCEAMAAITIDLEIFKKQEFITINDPAVGGGALLIAAAEYLHENKINFQHCMHATAVDVSETAAYMCYIQLYLLGVPAMVVVGNSLSLETREVLHTSMHWLNMWNIKLKRGPYQYDYNPANDYDLILKEAEESMRRAGISEADIKLLFEGDTAA